MSMGSASIALRTRESALRERASGLRVSRSVAVVGVLTALAAVARVVDLASQSYWYDEAHTVWILHSSIGEMLGRIQSSETSPPFYFILAWPWAHLFGYGEDALRSLSALAGIATVPIVYAAGSKLMSRRTGMIAAVLTACNPLLVWYSQEARSYALMVLLTAVALLAFAHLRLQPTRRWVVTWAVASGLALATHYYAALAIVPEAIWLFGNYRSNRMIRLGLEGVVVSSSALAIFVLEQLRFLTGNNWIAKVPLSWRAGEVPKAFAVGPAAPLGRWLLLASAISVGVAAWLIIRRAEARERASILFLARLPAGGFVLVIVLIALGFDQVDSRNMIALWLPTALVIAGGLGVRRAGLVGTAAAGVLCAIGIAVVIGVAADGRLQRPDWSGVAHALGSSPTRAIFALNGCQLRPLSLYVPGLHFAPADGAAVNDIDVIVASNVGNWEQVLISSWYVTCRPQPRYVSIPRRLVSFREIGAPVRIGQFVILRFRSPHAVVLTKRIFAAAGLRGALMVQRPGSSGPAG
ncbi:MAG: glycosyltransferase family 39 protein [Actinomycetota bacterium]|nr:glycosyltransferase family 39 protein [Actinomycetota bacterium]